MGRVAFSVFSVAAIAAFIWFAFNWSATFLAISGLISLVGAIAWVVKQGQTKRCPGWLKPWLAGIRDVPEVLAKEIEYNVVVRDAGRRC